MNPELKYREEIPSGFNLWLEMQWFGQFEPEKIIAVNANELNHVPPETYAVPQAMILLMKTRKKLPNPFHSDLNSIPTDT